MAKTKTSGLQRFLMIATLIFVLVGIGLRLYKITEADFIFYDEGYYLNFNRNFVEFINQHHFFHFKDWWEGFYTCLKLSLSTGKALWFFIVDSRAFGGWAQVWFFPRLVAALAGILSVGFIYILTRRFYNSTPVASLAVIFLSIVPSHVFYSRLAMQETLIALLFMMGFYFYLFPDRFNARTFLSAVILVGAYFTNYRLIVLPVLIFFTEIFVSCSQKRWPDLRRYIWHTLTFFLLVFAIGSINDAQNLKVTFSWMFHQAHLGQEKLDWFNFLSYPYYLSRLEAVPFGIIFFGNFYFLWRKQPFYFYPWALVIVQMLIFSFAQDKAARYLCVVMPFMVMAVSSLIVFLWQERKGFISRVLLGVMTVWILQSFAVKSAALFGFTSDYRSSIEYLKKIDPNVKVLSTQSWVQNLYLSKASVAECPRELLPFLQLYGAGFQYLIIDPQVYISYTEDGSKFNRQLKGFLRFITSQVQPIKVFAHFDKFILERFVFEHNENLKQSLAFLRSDDETLGQLRIYHIQDSVVILNQWLNRTQQLKR